MKTERDLHQYVKKICMKNSILFRKLRAEGVSGWPDCILAKNGKIIFIELKSPSGTGKLRPLQIRTIDAMKAEGLNVRVASQPHEIDRIVYELLGVDV
tara:strand:- start:2053 stop:2346 length:294 start_codon:yes stop_codon:yes gene_type:complete